MKNQHNNISSTARLVLGAWEKEASRFWHYDVTEECYILEGGVVVETQDGKKVQFGKGDFVTFPKGLACVWDIKKPVRKHYNFTE